ncbi:MULTISPECIES: hypothetical protein [unclassified Tenacibaculum]|uniref:hypothetical protein n=1 Tax=unclassified Tenacibaculum TaxID=2635139 RepID=UPI001F2038B2|nr:MULTISPECIES: hypothetical protein [unclassified Tenacibaculum]MCF2873225.1 hypothetical protein [Tenacibaculum sp. Cn5-1]MCF2933381.1 hypothetical protein [Tenacibaculum sp. Cn5-34]MCG7510038.1 hypothetical protein [Tenacibaculum sp. Cn5-46]
MRTGILFLLAIMSLATVNANNTNKSTSKIGVTNRYDDVVTFVERGVQFHVFLNGDFDFNTHYKNTRYVDYYGRRTRVNRGVRIERDFKGRVRRVGNTFINYDSRGNVKRIGSVYIRYRFGQLSKVGNLTIRYDRWGNPRFYGNVKFDEYCGDDVYYNDNIDIDINIGSVFDYDDVYFYKRNFRRNYRQFKEDNNFYYYRAVPNAKIGKRSRIIKRRKQRRNHNDDLYFKATPEQKGKSRRNR